MHGLIVDLTQDYKKPNIVAVRSGDTVRVTQRVKEASKERLQVFEGLVIRVDRHNSLTARMTVRKLTFGVGVEKSFLLHSPNVAKIEVVKRAKVRRNYLSYMRARVGKAARLKSIAFDKATVNKFAAAQTPLETAKHASAETGQAATGEEQAAAVSDQTETAEAPAAREGAVAEEKTVETTDNKTDGGATAADDPAVKTDQTTANEDKSA